MSIDKPSFLFTYWRPWNENDNVVNNYLDYVKDVSLAKYSSDVVGKYIRESSREQIEAVNELGRKIGYGFNVISNQLNNTNHELKLLNQKLDIQVEQSKITHNLLENIIDLLQIPNSEKERQFCIANGLKYFHSAMKNESFYIDALEELLNAEQFKKQDSYILHKIGLIYLYAAKFIDLPKALDYFERASRYALLEEDFKSKSAKENNKNTIDYKEIASDSYEKIAFINYVFGDFNQAVLFQKKAIGILFSLEKTLRLSKYYARNNQIENCLNKIDFILENDPTFISRIINELDLIMTSSQ
jgi:hypothetical protein